MKYCSLSYIENIWFWLRRGRMSRGPQRKAQGREALVLARKFSNLIRAKEQPKIDRSIAKKGTQRSIKLRFRAALLDRMKRWKKTKNKSAVRAKKDWLKVAGFRVLVVTPIAKSILHSKKTFSHGSSTFPLKVYHYLNTMLHPDINVLCVSPQSYPLSKLFSRNLFSADEKQNSRSC